MRHNHLFLPRGTFAYQEKEQPSISEYIRNRPATDGSKEKLSILKKEISSPKQKGTLEKPSEKQNNVVALAEPYQWKSIEYAEFTSKLSKATDPETVRFGREVSAYVDAFRKDFKLKPVVTVENFVKSADGSGVRYKDAIVSLKWTFNGKQLVAKLHCLKTISPKEGTGEFDSKTKFYMTSETGTKPLSALRGGKTNSLEIEGVNTQLDVGQIAKWAPLFETIVTNGQYDMQNKN